MHPEGGVGQVLSWMKRVERENEAAGNVAGVEARLFFVNDFRHD